MILSHDRERTYRKMMAIESTSWGNRMDEEALITEITDDAAICAKLRRQTNLIKELTNNFTNAYLLDIDLMHELATHARLIQNMTHWQKELNSLESEVSKLCCPVVNCAHHKSTPSKKQSKRPLSSVFDETSNSTQYSKTPKNQNEKTFKFPSKRLTAKSIPQLENNKTNPSIDANKFQNLETDKDDAGENTKFPASPIMLRKREHLTSDLKLVNDEFGEVESKSGGILIKLFTKTPEQHTKLTKFLATKNLQFFVFSPKRLRPIKVVIKELPWESKPQEI
ncbi:hypothetical protein AVEN_12511-1 [Araneus ventricosus]|uniref:Uncharacterized protein n=1 Tax=Araneus ventricosus TaxID=182803 RepID=A0A4Y2VN31_ARAVE|nr:hypothetical protein AVEN_12511-1 [Araneus ventricosus]